MGYYDFESCYATVIVHPEWNLVCFVGVRVERAVIAYNMDTRKVHFIPIHYIPYGRHDILPEITQTIAMEKEKLLECLASGCRLS
jgi:hypothetical protein